MGFSKFKILFVLPCLSILFLNTCYERQDNKTKISNLPVRKPDSLLASFQANKVYPKTTSLTHRNIEKGNGIQIDNYKLGLAEIEITIKKQHNYQQIIVGDKNINLQNISVIDFYDTSNFVGKGIKEMISFAEDEAYEYSGKVLFFDNNNSRTILLRSVPTNCNGTGCWSSYMFVLKILDNELESVYAIKYYNYYEIFDWNKLLFTYNSALNSIESLYFIPQSTWNSDSLIGYIFPCELSLKEFGKVVPHFNSKYHFKKSNNSE